MAWTYIIENLNDEEIFETYYEKKFQNTNQKKFGVEKVIKRKGHELYVIWKCYDNLFNSGVEKKDIVIQNQFISRTI